MTDEALAAGAVARRLGIAVTTLRTWHQRYGLGPSEHLPGQHRRYTPQDLDRLEVMRRLTTQGVAPAEAAAWARRMPLPPVGAATAAIDAVWPTNHIAIQHTPGSAGQHPPDLAGEPDQPGNRRQPGGPSQTDTPPATTPPASTLPHRSARDGGGNVIPTGQAGPAARGLARAAIRLDAPALRDILEREVARQGVVGTWERVIMPVLLGIGERYEATRRLIDVEHLTSRCITEVLSSVPRPGVAAVPQVLLACANEDQHTLPLEALAAALAEHGAPSRLLGARVPPQALAEAVARTGPTVVVVWSQIPRTAVAAHLTALLEGPHRPLLTAAAGPGWAPGALPPEIPILGSLADAVRIVLAAVALAQHAG